MRGLKRNGMGGSLSNMKRSGRCNDLVGNAHLLSGVPLTRSGLSGCLDDIGLSSFGNDVGFGLGGYVSAVAEIQEDAEPLRKRASISGRENG